MSLHAALIALPALVLGVIAVVFIAITFLLITRWRKLLHNTVLGLIALLVINWLGKSYGVSIGINLLTVAFTAVLGLAGVGVLIILHLAGVRL